MHAVLAKSNYEVGLESGVHSSRSRQRRPAAVNLCSRKASQGGGLEMGTAELPALVPAATPSAVLTQVLIGLLLALPCKPQVP